MSFKSERPIDPTLVIQPSTSFSSTSTGPSRLLFGEIDSSDSSAGSQSSPISPSACNLVLSTSSTFTRFWLSDSCRDNLLSHVPRRDLANLRLVCKDFGPRAAPRLFDEITVTFRTNTFTKRARLAALNRIGHLVKSFAVRLPHTAATQLPPLIDPWTGEEKEFAYVPQIRPSNRSAPKYGDEETTDLLVRQYPPLFHAATNVGAFIRVFAALGNLTRLRVACPNQDDIETGRRSIVDYALVSLRIALERNDLDFLTSLTLAPIHASGVLYLSPLLGFGAEPGGLKTWSRVGELCIEMKTPDLNLHRYPDMAGQDDTAAHISILRTYIRNFPHLHHLEFCWISGKGPSPLPFCKHSPASSPVGSTTRDNGPGPPLPRCHPAHRSPSTPDPGKKRLVHLQSLTHLRLENVSTSAAHVREILSTHLKHLEDLDLENVTLSSGTWDEALEPVCRKDRHGADTWLCDNRAGATAVETGDVPIMFAPSTFARSGDPVPCVRRSGMHRVDSGVQLSGVVPEPQERENARPSSKSSKKSGKQSDSESKPNTSKCSRPGPTVGTHKKVHDIPALDTRRYGSKAERGAIIGDGGAAAGVRQLLCEEIEQQRSGRKKTRHFWGCEEMKRVLKGGIMRWR
ncbi:hypothetical protein MBLNU459_g3690t1 [Dothideomycetes sp. NU459]